MYIDQLTIWNFRSFGATAPEVTDNPGTSATIVKLDAAASVFIGRNGAGKSSLVQALLRLFGENRPCRSASSSLLRKAERVLSMVI
ncbi:AAA family ATPase [Brevundimonas sp. 1080]|uniref:AAA family ATPase n=1 Tax=Brevundimonas sp. 1080 TaxID=3156405 RepID=UPI0033969777